MESEFNATDSILNTWRTNNRITIFLIEHMPSRLWTEKVPGYKRKTIQMIGGHLHNTRCMWIKTAGKKFDIDMPGQVDRYRVTRKELISSLGRSSRSVLKLLQKGMESGKNLPGFSLDTVHFLNYLVAHEAHHRGQIIMVARQLDFKLPEEVTYGVWKWSKRSKEI